MASGGPLASYAGLRTDAATLNTLQSRAEVLAPPQAHQGFDLQPQVLRVMCNPAATPLHATTTPVSPDVTPEQVSDVCKSAWRTPVASIAAVRAVQV